SSENSFRKTESVFVFSVSPHFCFSRSTTLRVVALQRAGNASVICFENRFGLGTIETPTNKKALI
ncbi:hypothetical protein K8Q94_02275, partial [Candidatus Nomurabacteria bacterium]|nr:hypothetical protein [Candidatus Nomurabacteria bacterium]